MSELQRVIVVGASYAGLRAAEALRRSGFDGELVMVGAEPHQPYDRPTLTKGALAGYYATFGLSGLTMTSDPWRQVFAVIGAVVIGVTAWARLAASPSGGPGAAGRPALS